MEIAQIKYENFINFIKEHMKHHLLLKVLETATFDQFLEKLESLGGKSPHEITVQMCDKCNISISDYSKETVEKFERYIEYFQKISHIMYV